MMLEAWLIDILNKYDQEKKERPDEARAQLIAEVEMRYEDWRENGV